MHILEQRIKSCTGMRKTEKHGKAGREGSTGMRALACNLSPHFYVTKLAHAQRACVQLIHMLKGPMYN